MALLVPQNVDCKLNDSEGTALVRFVMLLLDENKSSMMLNLYYYVNRSNPVEYFRDHAEMNCSYWFEQYSMRKKAQHTFFEKGKKEGKAVRSISLFFCQWHYLNKCFIFFLDYKD